MDKIDKVIKGLECCSRTTAEPNCEECPYYTNKLTCDNDMMADALALLKAQEPRVISWQDAETMQLCWVETKFPHTIRPSDLLQYFDESPCVTVFSIHQTPIDWPIDEYGIKWRCWDKEPTIEQMEAVKWE